MDGGDEKDNGLANHASSGSASNIVTSNATGGDGFSSLQVDATARVTDIFERAVTAAPFCLEIWEAFVSHVLEGSGNDEKARIEGVERWANKRILFLLFYKWHSYLAMPPPSIASVFGQ